MFVRENCAAELNQPLDELAREQVFEEEFDLDAGHAQVEELRSRLEGFGAVNMMAIEEMAEERTWDALLIRSPTCPLIPSSLSSLTINEPWRWTVRCMESQ